MVIAYAKFSRGVIATIETTDYKLVDELPKNYNGINDTTKQLYVTSSFKILSLEYVNGQQLESHIVHFNGITAALNHHNSIELEYYIKLEVTNIYVGILITFYLNKELAFMKNFGFDKEWELFENGFTGQFEAYDEYGCLVFRCLHTNGKIHDSSEIKIGTYCGIMYGLRHLNI